MSRSTWNWPYHLFMPMISIAGSSETLSFRVDVLEFGGVDGVGFGHGSAS